MEAPTERPAAPPEDVDYVAASGSCARCGRALNLASAKVAGRWYCSPICASELSSPIDRRPPAVPEPALYSRPHRHLRRRLPKELKASDSR